MWIPQCAQCFLHFWRYNNVPWKPVCHWDFDILMWLLPSWCDFLPTRCYMGLMWLLPNWCDLNPSLVVGQPINQLVLMRWDGDLFLTALLSHERSTLVDWSISGINYPCFWGLPEWQIPLPRWLGPVFASTWSVGRGKKHEGGSNRTNTVPSTNLLNYTWVSHWSIHL